ncbi:HU family DNA-binding protein [Devosia sp. YIM 151766]|uniref:HU family DNA-binding protein n=1 Tax=Devosia sp. YIM 151766 TaxID=3017325 RepID=UPI00255CBCB9|nr:HU family DNA-binding protein [Devosia sp. YIM 151766]WIY53126.1 HU family DNA-binding protein [Devosia sp. YIM 151766]
MDKTVTRAMLSEQAAEANKLARADVTAIGQRMFELIGAALAAGETVKLTGFGSLQVRSRAERIGRNPRTGEEHAIAPHQAVIFIPGIRLRTALQQRSNPGKPRK